MDESTTLGVATVIAKIVTLVWALVYFVIGGIGISMGMDMYNFLKNWRPSEEGKIKRAAKKAKKEAKADKSE